MPVTAPHTMIRDAHANGYAVAQLNTNGDNYDLARIGQPLLECVVAVAMESGRGRKSGQRGLALCYAGLRG